MKIPLCQLGIGHGKDVVKLKIENYDKLHATRWLPFIVQQNELSENFMFDYRLPAIENGVKYRIVIWNIERDKRNNSKKSKELT